MSFLSDFKAINKVVFKKTNESYIKNLLLVPMFGIYVGVYVLLFMALMLTIGQLGNAGSFLASIISWFFSAYMISDFLTHLENAVNGFKFSFKEIGKNYMRYFLPSLTALAIPSIIARLFVALTGIAIPFTWIVLFYLAYATAEVIYQKNEQRLEIFAYGHKFILENWQQWLLVNVIHGGVIIIYMIIVNAFIMAPLNAALVTLPLILGAVISYLIWSVIVGVPLLYYMIYRGYIFKILSVSSRRKREYMRNIYGK